MMMIDNGQLHLHAAGSGTVGLLTPSIVKFAYAYDYLGDSYAIGLTTTDICRPAFSVGGKWLFACDSSRMLTSTVLLRRPQ